MRTERDQGQRTLLVPRLLAALVGVVCRFPRTMLAVAAVLCGLWALAVFVFDRQVYMVFIPSQFRVCQQIGGGEQVFPTEGMTLERHRSDLFRHWILGMGSGDLTVHTSGAQSAHIDLPNVLFIGRKVEQIENMIKKKAVVQTG